MAKVMKASDLALRLRDIALNYKTLYVMGCFGAPMTEANKKRYINHHSYNQSAARTKMINDATADTFGFDCVCLIKGVLWGWTGDKKKIYGGANYATKGVADLSADGMFNLCTEVSTDFSDIEIGEALWSSGHIGVYIGNGLAVECTPAWKNKVQITACNREVTGFPTRKWKKHGKLPYLDYDVKKDEPAKTTASTAKKSVDEIAREVIDGKWYTGAARKSALTKAGYDYAEVQKKVNELLSGKKSVDEIAREVIEGKWYTGAARKSALTKAGYDYAEVQKKVNELLS